RVYYLFDCSGLLVYRASNRMHLASPLLTDPQRTDIYPLSLHDALPIYEILEGTGCLLPGHHGRNGRLLRLFHQRPEHHQGDLRRSEEHTSELQSRENLVCRLLLEKKNSRGLSPSV